MAKNLRTSLYMFFVCVVLAGTLFAETTVGIAYDENLNASHPTMQDGLTDVLFVDGSRLLGVYDGHGRLGYTQDGHLVDSGAFCANYASCCLVQKMTNLKKKTRGALLGADILSEFTAWYTEIDDFLATCWEGVYGGTTATTVLHEDNKLQIAHAGDCRVLVGNEERCDQLTVDHILWNTEDLVRIFRAGGSVYHYPDGKGMSRIMRKGKPDLNVVRTLGDSRFDRPDLVSPEPDTLTYELRPDDQYVLLASDGIFEVLTNKKVQLAMQESLIIGRTAKQAAQEVVSRAKGGRSYDNLTVVVMLFDKEAIAAPKRESERSIVSASSSSEGSGDSESAEETKTGDE